YHCIRNTMMRSIARYHGLPTDHMYLRARSIIAYMLKIQRETGSYPDTQETVEHLAPNGDGEEKLWSIQTTVDAVNRLLLRVLPLEDLNDNMNNLEEYLVVEPLSTRPDKIQELQDTILRLITDREFLEDKIGLKELQREILFLYFSG